MHGVKIVHILIYEFRYPDLRQISMRFIPDKPHGKNIAQRCGNQGGVFPCQEF